MDVEIIEYEDALVEQIVTMWRPSQKLAFGQDSIHNYEEDVRFIKETLSKNTRILLAKSIVEERIVGMVAFTPSSVSQLYIDIDSINEGIGTQLLDIAKKESIGSLELYTYQTNLRSRSFYEKHDFKEVAQGDTKELNLPDIMYQWTSESSD